MVGLGNPGERYRRTRHNAGFMAVDVLAARTRAAGSVRGGAWVAETSLAGAAVVLVKPLSFMNGSGGPVREALAAGEGAPSDLVVLVDDVALDLGVIRVRERGSHGGHNGLRSIEESIGTADFPRIRIGVRRGELPFDLAQYVLADFAGRRDAPRAGGGGARGGRHRVPSRGGPPRGHEPLQRPAGLGYTVGSSRPATWPPVRPEPLLPVGPLGPQRSFPRGPEGKAGIHKEDQ